MGVIVAFNYATWVQSFPKFAKAPEPLINGLILNLAQRYQANDGSGPICDATLATDGLNLLVAHIAQLMLGPNGDGQPSGVVGRITDAAEGSVSVSADWPGADANSAFFLQTPFGAMWWQLMAPFRLGRYYPKITPQYQPLGNPFFGPGPGYFGGYRR